jgi:outer membrane protein, adhesin transport system
MSIFEKTSSKTVRSWSRRDRRARLQQSALPKSIDGLATQRVGCVRLVIAVTLVSLLSGCVTTSSAPSPNPTALLIPSSPFLSAVASLSPFSKTPGANAAVADASPAVMNANAAVIDSTPTGSTPPATVAAQPAGQSGPATPVVDRPATVPVERREVYPQIASASSDMAKVLIKPSAPSPDITGSIPHDGRAPGQGVSLGDAISAAVMSHPLMGAQAARVTGSLADVRTAQGAINPQLQVYAGSGGSYLGTYVTSPNMFGSVAIPASERTDVGFTLRQLVYDFGAAKADIARSRSVVDAERLRLADEAEDIALRTANAYVNLLEQSELIAMIDKVVADDNSFAELVKLSEKQGNATVADVDRIKSKVIEVEALRTDISTAYSTAQDEFFRLTKLRSKQVFRPASILSQVPGSFAVAFGAAQQSNPLLLALNATGVSIDHQLDSQKAQALPRVDVQGDGLVKHYVGTPAASQGIVDSRLMLMVSYKLLDGGVQSALADRIREDRRANDFRALDEKESIELNLKRFYQALSANKSKESAALQGNSTAQRAHALYLEQFKAGKRTVFEVLDSRMVVFTMQKNAVDARYEQLRSAYGILRNIGRLVETAIRY